MIAIILLAAAVIFAFGIRINFTTTHLTKEIPDVTIHQDIADIKARLDALPAEQPATDLQPLTDAVAALTTKVDGLIADVGTPA